MAKVVVIHTGTADSAGKWVEAIQAAGIEVRVMPAIAIEDSELTSAAKAEVERRAPYSLVVVTSARAAAKLKTFARWTGGAQVAAVGAATAEACRREGFEPKWIGGSGRRTFLESVAGQMELGGKPVLFPRGDLVEEASLPELAARGARVVSPIVYRTVAVPHPAAEVLAALGGAAGVTLTSPSGVRAFTDAADAAGAGRDARRLFAATLGPTTEAAAQKAGFSWRGVCRRPSPAALADLLRNALRP